MAENAREIVTRSELLEREIAVKEDFNGKLDLVNGKVDKLEEFILPWTQSLVSIDQNTKRMADNYEKTNEKQDQILSNYHKQNLRLEKLEGATTIKGERIKGKTAIIVAGITALGAAGGLIGVFGEKLAHLIFGG
ncbi:hypothetical protein ACIQLG_19650 [Terribacillus saccharophilus]|uniref:hypothetical protein n=1 Tax=Terribacillus saccharophilus TaxID=361277 RepID=UPI0038301CF4